MKNVEKNSDGTLKLTTQEGGTIDNVNTLIWAIGRHALTKDLGLDKVGVKMDNKGQVIVDEFQNSNVKNIYALGDVCGRFLLTPGMF